MPTGSASFRQDATAETSRTDAIRTAAYHYAVACQTLSSLPAHEAALLAYDPKSGLSLEAIEESIRRRYS